MSAHGFLSRREIINDRKITANTAKEGITQDLKNKIENTIQQQTIIQIQISKYTQTCLKKYRCFNNTRHII